MAVEAPDNRQRITGRAGKAKEEVGRHSRKRNRQRTIGLTGKEIG